MKRNNQTITPVLFKASIEKKLIKEVESLIRKAFSLKKVTIYFNHEPAIELKLDSVGFEYLFETGDEQQGLVVLEGLNKKSLSTAELKLLKNILVMLTSQHLALGLFDEVQSRLILAEKEVKVLSTELELAYSDLNTAHQELSDAYNLGQLISRNLSRTRIELKSFLEQAPIAFGILRHRRLKIEIANALILKLWGKNKSVIGKTLEIALPELAGQPYLGILDNVYTTGERYVGREAPVSLEVKGKIQMVYFNFIYEPIKNEKGITNAIMIIATDVTEMVQNRLTG
ncbi:hypothetical protein [Pedobacter sp.]|uniref:hypothetical protein n=1 Tax=Pedobacter sp. TaxID=1411316 RepID=UPI003BAD3C67